MSGKSNKKIKNIIIVNDYNCIKGGADKVAIQTANMFAAQKKYNVYFFSGCSCDKKDLSEDVIDVCANQPENLSNKNKLVGAFRDIYNFGTKKELKKLLMTLDKDETILHIHGYTKSLSSSVFSIIDKMGFKMCITLHDYFSVCPNGAFFNYGKGETCHLKPLSFKCLFCNCDSRNYLFKLFRVVRQKVQNRVFKKTVKNVITISNFQENVIKKHLNDVKMTRINNPVDFDKNSKRVDITKNDIYLFVGRVTPGKGVDIFCEALTSLNLKGIVVGAGPDYEKLKNQYKNIEFVGWKNSDEVREYMKKARVLIFPSIFYEAAPLTPFEAMQFGVPCISSDCCAAIDNINKNTGLSFDPYKKGDLEKKIEEFNKMDLKKLSVGSYNYCHNYNVDYVQELLKYYEEVINEKEGKTRK